LGQKLTCCKAGRLGVLRFLSVPPGSEEGGKGRSKRKKKKPKDERKRRSAEKKTRRKMQDSGLARYLPRTGLRKGKLEGLSEIKSDGKERLGKRGPYRGRNNLL